MSFSILVGITDDLKPEYPENPAWNNSAFKWLRCLPPGSKGRVGRDIATGMLRSYGFTPMTGKNTTILVNGSTVEVRFALMWDNGIIKYENIRDRKFDYILCFALLPSDALAWLIPKEQIWKDSSIRKDVVGIKSQHKGADAWLTINPHEPHLWLKQFGGTLEEMIQAAQSSL